MSKFLDILFCKRYELRSLRNENYAYTSVTKIHVKYIIEI